MAVDIDLTARHDVVLRPFFLGTKNTAAADDSKITEEHKLKFACCTTVREIATTFGIIDRSRGFVFLRPEDFVPHKNGRKNAQMIDHQQQHSVPPAVENYAVAVGLWFSVFGVIFRGYPCQEARWLFVSTLQHQFR